LNTVSRSVQHPPQNIRPYLNIDSNFAKYKRLNTWILTALSKDLNKYKTLFSLMQTWLIWFVQLKLSEISIPRNFTFDEYISLLLLIVMMGLFIGVGPLPWNSNTFVLFVLIFKKFALNQSSNAWVNFTEDDCVV
jgi:hypothetical protein